MDFFRKRVYFLLRSVSRYRPRVNVHFRVIVERHSPAFVLFYVRVDFFNRVVIFGYGNFAERQGQRYGFVL